MRTLLRAVAVVLAAVLVPAAVAGLSAASTFGAQYTHGPERAVPAAAPLPHDPALPTAVVVLGDNGAEVADVLVPYEILASTGRFNVYTVAPQRRPLPLLGGLDLVPDLTFDDLADRVAVADLVVVPAMPDVGEPSTAPVTEWLRGQVAGGAQVLSVCNGASVLASAGLLDGRRATSHWLRIGPAESRYPQVDWVRGQRVVDDGDVVSTGGVLSGVDGTLHVLERMAGPAVAAETAAAIGWRFSGQVPPVHSRIGVPDPVAIVNAGFRLDPATVGVLLTDGVGEIELASVFELHGGQSLAARTLALSADGGAVRSRHGLLFLPRGDLGGAAGQLDRLLVPGGARGVAPVPGGPEPEYPHDRPGFAFDAALVDLAATTDLATAQWAATATELPTDGLALDGPAWPWAPTALAVALALLGATAAATVTRPRSRAREQALRP